MLLNELALHLLRRAGKLCLPLKCHFTPTNFTEDFWLPNILIFVTGKYDGRHPVAVGWRAVVMVRLGRGTYRDLSRLSPISRPRFVSLLQICPESQFPHTPQHLKILPGKAFNV